MDTTNELKLRLCDKEIPFLNSKYEFGILTIGIYLSQNYKSSHAASISSASSLTSILFGYMNSKVHRIFLADLGDCVLVLSGFHSIEFIFIDNALCSAQTAFTVGMSNKALIRVT